MGLHARLFTLLHLLSCWPVVVGLELDGLARLPNFGVDGCNRLVVMMLFQWEQTFSLLIVHFAFHSSDNRCVCASCTPVFMPYLICAWHAPRTWPILWARVHSYWMISILVGLNVETLLTIEWPFCRSDMATGISPWAPCLLTIFSAHTLLTLCTICHHNRCPFVKVVHRRGRSKDNGSLSGIPSPGHRKTVCVYDSNWPNGLSVISTLHCTPFCGFGPRARLLAWCSITSLSWKYWSKQHWTWSLLARLAMLQHH